jgi:hypothetical protein
VRALGQISDPEDSGLALEEKVRSARSEAGSAAVRCPIDGVDVRVELWDSPCAIRASWHPAHASVTLFHEDPADAAKSWQTIRWYYLEEFRSPLRIEISRRRTRKSPEHCETRTS